MRRATGAAGAAQQTLRRPGGRDRGEPLVTGSGRTWRPPCANMLGSNLMHLRVSVSAEAGASSAGRKKLDEGCAEAKLTYR